MTEVFGTDTEIEAGGSLTTQPIVETSVLSAISSGIKHISGALGSSKSAGIDTESVINATIKSLKDLDQAKASGKISEGAQYPTERANIITRAKAKLSRAKGASAAVNILDDVIKRNTRTTVDEGGMTITVDGHGTPISGTPLSIEDEVNQKRDVLLQGFKSNYENTSKTFIPDVLALNNPALVEQISEITIDVQDETALLLSINDSMLDKQGRANLSQFASVKDYKTTQESKRARVSQSITQIYNSINPTTLSSLIKDPNNKWSLEKAESLIDSITVDLRKLMSDDAVSLTLGYNQADLDELVTNQAELRKKHIRMTATQDSAQRKRMVEEINTSIELTEATTLYEIPKELRQQKVWTEFLRPQLETYLAVARTYESLRLARGTAPEEVIKGAKAAGKALINMNNSGVAKSALLSLQGQYKSILTTPIQDAASEKGKVNYVVSIINNMPFKPAALPDLDNFITVYKNGAKERGIDAGEVDAILEKAYIKRDQLKKMYEGTPHNPTKLLNDFTKSMTALEFINSYKQGVLQQKLAPIE